MTAPDRIQITHAQPMIMPHTALTSDDIPPGPFSEDDLRRGWNQQADEHNQWESLDSGEQLAWAQALAIKADRHAALFDQQEAELAALRGVPVAELDDQHRAAVRQAVAEALGSGAYDCTRVWSAWQVGTMGEDDFVLVAEDPDRVAEIADAAIEAIRAIPAPQAREVEA